MIKQVVILSQVMLRSLWYLKSIEEVYKMELEGPK
jgi:hypothetical protein